eukprot:COSAG02_NODE_60916_length_270_cov_0.590643_1_plen_39_part_01
MEHGPPEARNDSSTILYSTDYYHELSVCIALQYDLFYLH